MSQSSEGESLSHRDKRVTAICKAAHYGGTGIFVAMMIITVVHGIGRYGFDRPIPGLIELSSYMLVGGGILVGAYTMVLKGHITIGMLVDRLSERTQALIDSITYILCLVFAIVALWQAFVQGLFLMPTGQSSNILDIPVFPFLFIIGIGWGLLCLAIVMHLVHFLPRAVKK